MFFSERIAYEEETFARYYGEIYHNYLHSLGVLNEISYRFFALTCSTRQRIYIQTGKTYNGIDQIGISKNSRGKPLIYHDGFVYTQHRLSDKKRSFRCESRDGKSKFL